MSVDMNPDFSKGLVPAVVQDADSGKVLMLAYMDEESWKRTRESGQAWFHSRERGLWRKGETSGNTMEVLEARLDCDLDALTFGNVDREALDALFTFLEMRAPRDRLYALLDRYSSVDGATETGKVPQARSG